MRGFQTMWSFFGRPQLGALLATAIVTAAAPAQDAPVLFFSDLTSGPRTGNTDSSGGRTPGQDGAIVTIWGRNLGSTQGGSKVYCNGAQAASYYSWGNATSPANLYASHQMQSVSFQVSSSAQNGAGSIYVMVNGQQSNSLPFTVRSGNIRFVKTSGNDGSGSGSWSSPWRTIPKAVASLAIGDIAYICDGVNQTTVTEFDAAVNLGSNGSAAGPKALVVYPGAASNVGNPNIARAFHPWNTAGGSDYSQYWVISRFTIISAGVGVFANTGFRVVGNRFTGPNTIGDWEATLYAFGSDVALFGNELHDIGTPQNTSKAHSPIYLTGARQTGGARLPTERNRDAGWNYIHDNYFHDAFHIYSEQDASAFIQGHRIHDNVIVNQRGDGILMGYYVTGENWIYNNLIVRAGLGPEFDDPSPSYHTGIHFDTGHETIAQGSTVIHCYNNTLYGCGFAGAAYSGENGALIVTPEAISRSTLNIWNNIIRSTGNPYVAGESGTPSAGSFHNCWYGDGAAPAWDTGAINADPQFVNAGADNYRLSSSSPCRDAGINVSATVSRDIDGTTRPQGSGVDVGAYEYHDSVPVCRVSCSANVPASAAVGDPVLFQAVAALVDCGGGSVAYWWDFGDGSTSTEQSPLHAYATDGAYPWSLTTTATGAVPCGQNGTIGIGSAAGGADLTGSWTKATRKGSRVSATFSCRNAGATDSGGFEVRFYFSRRASVNSKSTLLKSQSVGPLAAGASAAVKVSGTPTSKHKYLIAVVDALGEIIEADESNNTISRRLP